MNITLQAEQQRLVELQLATGKYADVLEVIAAGLRLLEGQERRLAELREKIAVGTRQIDQGQVVDGETVFAQLEQRLERLPEQGA